MTPGIPSGVGVYIFIVGALHIVREINIHPAGIVCSIEVAKTSALIVCG
jgi:hypothetical protein